MLAEEDRLISVGNFDALSLAACLDFLRIALAPLLTSAQERLVKLLQAPISGLPQNLAARPGGVDLALSELGVVGQALAAEARLLAAPVSYELASTSHDQGLDDRMTMAPLAARRVADMVALGERVITTELVVAAQAIDLRRDTSLGRGTQRLHDLVRQEVGFTGDGEHPPRDLEGVRGLVRSGVLSTLVTPPSDVPVAALQSL